MALTTHNILRAAELSRAVYDCLPDWVVVRDNGITYVAIEGSDELVDWRRNVEFVFTSDDIHAGFQNYCCLLMSKMLASGVSFSRNEQLVISGHSLGGAVATIMAHHLHRSHPRVDLVTFGSPRPGGRRFRDRFRVPHHRYTRGNDPVPHLPSALLGFRHTVPAQVLPVPDDSLLRGIKDHDMDGYRIALEEHLNG